MASVSYVFPAINDLDAADIKSISVVKESLTNSLPSFMIFSSPNSLTINPILMSQVKVYTMIVIITDTKATVQYSFKITVTN